LGSSDHPLLRTAAILFGALGILYFYIGIGSYFNWPPFGYYPSLGSPAYIAVYFVGALILTVVDWLRFRGHVRVNEVQVGIVRK